MMRNLLATLLLCGALGLTGVARADVPRLINFQGRLADSAGTPLTGSYTITFRIYDATTGGTACHNAAQATAVNSGLFNVSIGSPAGINAACSFAVPYYLEVQVGTDAPMSPRIAMTASAFSLGAASLVRPGANTSHTLGNAANQVPFSNGAVNVSLNADTVDGYHYADIMSNSLGQITKPLYQCTLTYVTGCSTTDGITTCTTGSMPVALTTVAYDGPCYQNTSGCNTAAPACAAGCTDMGVTTSIRTCSPLFCGTCPNGATIYTRHCSCPTLLGYVRSP